MLRLLRAGNGDERRLGQPASAAHERIRFDHVSRFRSEQQCVLYISGIDRDMNEVPRGLIRAGGHVRRAFGETNEEGCVDGEQIDLRYLHEREQTSRVRMVEEYELANDVGW